MHDSSPPLTPSLCIPPPLCLSPISLPQSLTVTLPPCVGSLTPSPSPSHSLLVLVPHNLTFLCCSLTPSPSHLLSPCVAPSHSHRHTRSLPVLLPHTHTITLAFSLCCSLTPSPSPSRSLTPSPSHSLSLCWLPHTVTLAFSLCCSLSSSLSPSHPHHHPPCGARGQSVHSHIPRQ